jgi:uncharacterized SAM-binding protein YcdF (DUF218 family)
MRENMFMFKKIVTHFLLPPGIFAVALLATGAWFLIRRNRAAGFTNIALGVALWLLTIAPVSSALMSGLETGLRLPANPRGDVIILLGGGIYSEAEDFSGMGAPTENMLARLVTAVRLQKKLRVPIIVSSGAVFPWERSEAIVNKRFLIDLGVPKDKIFLEEKSRDTIENARYSKELCEKYGFRNPLLVTSSYHMKRALLSFRKVDFAVTPYPANLHAMEKEHFVCMDYLPGNPESALVSIREYLGLLFYKLAY